MRVFVTGGAGYIGSHTCVELLAAGYDVVVYDNFSNSSPIALQRVQDIAQKKLQIINGDIRERAKIEDSLKEHKCEAVIHFAGLKAVGESVEKPLEYFDNNVVGSLSLFEAMESSGVKTILFSSSATVYGVPQKLPLTEDHPLSALNPYGETKLVIENILRDLASKDSSWNIGILRYFNPVGAHESGTIGEDPRGIPNNLVPFIAQVAVGKREKLQVWGNDYPTLDGTGVRDYIHVVDLARGHLLALNKIVDAGGMLTVNLGTGRGYSVLEVVSSFEKACGKMVPYCFCARRAGDVAACYADATLAQRILGWQAEKGLEVMCEDVWRWQQKNPNGYQ